MQHKYVKEENTHECYDWNLRISININIDINIYIHTYIYFLALR